MTTIRTWAPGALLALSALASSTDDALKPADIKKLGKDVADYFEAKDKSEGIDKAYQEIADAVDKAEKRLGGKSALTLVEDWEQVFYQARLESLGNALKVRKGKPHEASAALPGGNESSFAVALPSSYNPKKGPYPLFLVLAPAGTEPLALLEEQWADADLLSESIVLAPKLPDDPAVWGEITTASGPGGVATIMSLYGQFLRQFPIDMDRVFLVGYGAGGATAARVAGLYPHLFAGLVTVDPQGAIDPTNFKSLPTLVVGGTEDGKALLERIGELGYDNASARESATPADFQAWTAEHVRVPYPEEIVFAPLTAYTTSAHWISVDGVDLEGGARVRARLDRTANAVVVDAEKVTLVRLFFNDRLVDMDRPVDVIVNGVSKKALIDRNKRLMLDLNYQLGDWGRVFTNRLPFDVPTEESK